MRLPYQYASIIHEARVESLRRERRLQAMLDQAREVPEPHPQTARLPATDPPLQPRPWSPVVIVCTFLENRGAQ